MDNNKMEFFHFKCASPLPLEECSARLTPEYRENLRKNQQYIESRFGSWFTYISINKKGEVIVNSEWGRFSFVYKINSLEQCSNVTVLHCSYNPLRLTALFFPLLFAALLLIGSIVGIAEILFTTKQSSPEIIAAVFIFIILIIVFCVVIQFFARKAFLSLVDQLVHAYPIK